MKQAHTGMHDALAPLFQPKNVAVIGASRTQGKQGNSAFRHLVNGGFPGGIFAVNPAGEGGDIEGYHCYASIGDVPQRIDCALMVIPAAAVVANVRRCGELGVRSLIVASTGFAELGTDEGRERQQELLRVAREGGIRIVGPNTNGLYNATDRLCLGYNTSFGDPLDPGPVSIAAHSGALFNSIAPRLRQYGAGLGKFVPVGNEADLNMLDFIEYFIEDDATGVIGLIVEGLSDGARFRQLAERSRAAGKPIVALKLGRSSAGAGAAMAHSSRLAGSARAYDALFRECGVATVPTVEALAGGCAVLGGERMVSMPNDRSRALVCVSTSGGGSSLLADFAHEKGLPLAGGASGEWEGRVAQTIADLPGAGPIRNPTDIGSLGKQEQLADLFAAQEADGYTGPAVLFTHLLPNTKRSELLASQLIERKNRTPAPVVVVSPGGLTDALLVRYKSNGIPVFSDIATCFDSLRCYDAAFSGAAPSAPDEAQCHGSANRTARLRQVGAILERAAAGRKAFLSETESAEILRCAGVPVVESREVKTLAEAQAAALDAGYPVVLKALAPDEAHKSRIGFVFASVGDPGTLEQVYAEIERRIAARGYARSEVPVVLQPRLASKAELIVGVSHERPLGHFLVAGLGGIYTEILDEVMLLPVPIARARIRARLAETRLGRLLAVMSGNPENSGGERDLREALVDVLDGLQALVLRHGGLIESIDVNPLLAGEQGCIAVDALVVPRVED